MKQSLTLVIAVLALGVAAAGWLRPTPSQPTPAGTILVPAAAPRSPSPQNASSTPARTVTVRDPALVELLTDLQARFDRMELHLEEMQSGWQGLARRGLVPLTEEHEQELRAVVLDPAAAWRDRNNAYRLLRRHGKVTDDVAMAMVQVAQTGSDERTRAEALENLDGIENPVIKTALVQALADTGSARVRRNAADALSSFANDPSVTDWLRHAAANDEDPEVRNEARKALAERFRSLDQDELQKMIADPNLPPSEQVAASRYLDDDNKSSEVVSSMIDLFLGNDDPGLRAEILRSMDGSTDPAMKVPLLNWLASETDERVRGEAAENLRHFRTDPSVLEWLNYAAQHDPSRVVRRAAAEALRGRNRD